MTTPCSTPRASITSDDDHGKTEANTNTKAGRLIEEYDRGEGYGDRFERLWTADDDRREGLGGLANRFNRRLLRAAVDGEVDNLYRLLTDDVSSETRSRRAVASWRAASTPSSWSGAS